MFINRGIYHDGWWAASRTGVPWDSTPGKPIDPDTAAWELYNLDEDFTQANDLASAHPDRVRDMVALYEAWAERCGVIPREKILQLMREQGATAFWEEDEAA